MEKQRGRNTRRLLYIFCMTYLLCFLDQVAYSLFFLVQIQVASYLRMQAIQRCMLFNWESLKYVHYIFNQKSWPLCLESPHPSSRFCLQLHMYTTCTFTYRFRAIYCITIQLAIWLVSCFISQSFRQLAVSRYYIYLGDVTTCKLKNPANED